MKKLFVISLGGSIIHPDGIDTGFLKQFKKLIEKSVKQGNRFIIITGGGKLCRRFNEALEAVAKPTAEDLDWMGINTTWTNAKLVQLMLKNLAYPDIARDPVKKIDFKQKVLVGGGWKPGRSSDGAMVKYAETYGAKTVINLSNIDYIFDKDPRKFKDAKPLKKLSWTELFKIIGIKWDPGINVPFDPTAAKDAQKNGQTVIIANGRNLKNLENILSNKPFIGTVIS